MHMCNILNVHVENNTSTNCQGPRKASDSRVLHIRIISLYLSVIILYLYIHISHMNEQYSYLHINLDSIQMCYEYCSDNIILNACSITP